MTPAERTPRHRGREAALQMLYQWEVGRAAAFEVTSTYWKSEELADVPEPLREFANTLVRGTIDRVEEIDRLIAARTANWRVERLAVLDRLILRLAIYELLADPATPGKVVINEAIELARTYSSEEAVGFVNGVLDAVRKDLNRE